MMKVSGVAFLMAGVCAVCSAEVIKNVSVDSIRCSLHCAYCNYFNECLLCDSGFFGRNCQQECNNCKPGTICTKDTGFCPVGCKDGLSGKYCNVSCDSRCLSCDRSNGTNCVSCKNQRNCDVACPVNCLGHSCYGSYCTVGCLPGSWGHSCENTCLANCSRVGCNRGNGTCPDVSSGTEHPTSSSAVEVVVSVLSVPLLIMVGVVIFKFLLERKPRHREQKMVEDKFLHTSHRYRVNGIKQHDNAWEFDNDSFENYANVENIGATKSTDRRTKEVVNVQSRESSIPDGTVDPTPRADVNEELDEHCVSKELKLAATIDIEDTYYNTVALKERRIPLQALAEYVNQMSDEKYQEEFESLPSVLIKPCYEALREENVLKNRYRGIYPYDITRVHISKKTSDYINANYVDGYNERRGYIASVGPTIKFMGDMSVFWRVVWHENCRTIVMLTRLVESEVIKCDEYWPEKDFAKKFGNFCITGIDEEKFETYVARTLKLEKLQSICDTEVVGTRTVRQFHYLAWPDKGQPESVSSLIEIRNAVNATKSKGDGPVLVHCSAGVGRTGTFIALDILTKEGEATGHVDINACVRNLREQRVKMVQTMAQYKFLHDALVYWFGKRHSTKTPAFSDKL